jgi:hypothetical protein
VADEVAADVALALSVLLYALTWQFDWYLSAYPNGFWIFNPFAGNCCSCSAPGARSAARADVADPVVAGSRCGSACLSAFAFFVTLTWHLPQLSFLMPKRLEQWMYPITKTDLDVLRFAHFLALRRSRCASCRKDWSGLKSPGCDH